VSLSRAVSINANVATPTVEAAPSFFAKHITSICTSLDSGQVWKVIPLSYFSELLFRHGQFSGHHATVAIGIVLLFNIKTHTWQILESVTQPYKILPLYTCLCTCILTTQPHASSCTTILFLIARMSS
jgi:hypothetical protein